MVFHYPVGVHRIHEWGLHKVICRRQSKKPLYVLRLRDNPLSLSNNISELLFLSFHFPALLYRV